MKMVREILKKYINISVDTIYKNSTVGVSGMSVLYIGCIVPKG